MTHSPKTSICIVSYNCAAVIGDCLRSIPAGYPVYVIDNNSRDNSLDVVRQTRPDAHIIDNRDNLGFGRGHNRLLHLVKTPFALLLNPDATLKTDTIQKLEQAAEQYPQAAIIGGLHVNHDGTEEPCFKSFQRHLTHITSVEMVSGALMLLRMDAFNGQFFDENIFLYFEDDDICFQAHRNGYEVLVEPAARIHHIVGHSSGSSMRGMWCRSYHFAWSHAYTQHKNFGRDRKFIRRQIAKSAKRLLISTALLRPVRAARFWGEICGYRAFMRGKKVV